MKAIGNNVVIVPVKVTGDKTKGGLLLAEIHRDDIRYLKAKIISAGEDALGVNKGDTVFYDKHAGHKIQDNQKIYHVIKSTDVVVVL